jgi:hypothetical protein
MRAKDSGGLRRMIYSSSFMQRPIALLLVGFSTWVQWEIAAGAGFSAYGMVNFTIHDVIYHKRLPLFRNVSNSYLKAAIKAHDAHHNPATPEDFRNFGLLIFPSKYFN